MRAYFWVSVQWIYKLIVGVPFHFSSDRKYTRPNLDWSNQYQLMSFNAEEMEQLEKIAKKLKLSRNMLHCVMEGFIKVDYLKRNIVSLQQILLYLNVRPTKAGIRLCTPKGVDALRSVESNIDVIYFFCMAFSTCTMSASQLVSDTLMRLEKDLYVLKKFMLQQQRIPLNWTKIVHKGMDESLTNTVIVKNIQQLMYYTIGTLSPKEERLRDLLTLDFYAAYLPPEKAQSKYVHVNCMKMHRIQSFRSVLYLFPVLMQPVVLIRKRMTKRIFGPSFWDHCKVQRKLNSDLNDIPRVGVHQLLQRSNVELNHSSNHSKVLPASRRRSTRIVKTSVQVESKDSKLVDTIEDAWKITARNIICTVHVQRQSIDAPGMVPMDIEFQRLSKACALDTLDPKELLEMKRSMIQLQGYGFTQEIFKHGAFSLEEPKAALEPLTKKLFDPKTERYFRYDYLSGEATWI